jgi:hypothetical protein
MSKRKINLGCVMNGTDKLSGGKRRTGKNGTGAREIILPMLSCLYVCIGN